MVTLDAGLGYASYEWSTNTQTIEVSQSGNYSVEVGNGQVNNYSMSFDGIDNVITLDQESSLLNSFNQLTFMTWIKPDDLLGYIEGFQNEG